MSNRIAVIVVLLFILSTAGSAQDPGPARDAEATKARRAKIVNVVLSDAAELRLPENRAFISAKLGALIWKEDPERGTTLFKNAIVDLIAAQSVAESNKNPNQQNYDLKYSQTLRPAVLNAIANADAEFALSSLYRTRPISIQKALGQAPRSAKINNGSNNFPQLAQHELNLEQRLMRMLAEQKPEHSIAFLKESIRKHLSNETLSMLKKIWSKDPAVGNELANEVVDRLISKSFVGPNNQIEFDLISLANSLFAEYLRERSPEEKSIAFAESKMRSLAEKLLSAFLERGGAMGYVPLEQLEPIAKRFSPGSYEQLKKAAANTRNSGRHGMSPGQYSESYSKLISSNPTADTMIAEAKNFPVETRQSIYSTAANKLIDSGQYERALALLNDNFEEETLEHAIGGLNWYYAHHLMNRGEYDAAEALIMEFNENNRISGLTSLATAVYNKNPDANRSRAIGILQRARTFLSPKPETSLEFSQLLQLINAMAGIEPNEAFRNFEPVIDQVNQLTEAWSVVNAFQGGNIRQGEYPLMNGFNFGVHVDPATFKTLAQKDFDRTAALIQGLQRREMRILILTWLLESGI